MNPHTVNPLEEELHRQADPHATPDATTQDLHQTPVRPEPPQPPMLKPAGKRERKPPAPVQPFVQTPLPTLGELWDAYRPETMGGIGLLLLSLVSWASNQTALAVILMLTLIGLVLWLLGVDGIPARTVMRTLADSYGLAVIRIIDSDDMDQPVRVIRPGHRYAVWHADRQGHIHTGILIPDRDRIALTDANETIIGARA
ncbi:hypothetical protein [Bifidobacterium felsineum]|uniref:hypothetical protein n=1 Tax=Bifidobacterium felsineum TaxID=2045440 RepID=UPI001BDCFCD9|nr:hypothetical protein [Bifidobacterium felsineum]MBT1164586.1 hypothetical protein [Bifidobacterium felsineum]